MKPDEFIDWLGIKPDLKGLAMVTLEGVIAKSIAFRELPKGYQPQEGGEG